jgi:hypothetical protein
MGAPWEKYGAAQVKQAPPGYQYQGPQAQATLARTQQEVAQAQATAGATTAKTKAEALSAEIAAKQAQEQYDAQHRTANTSGLYGADYLKTLSPSDQSMVKALTEGRLAFPTAAGLRSPFWQEKLSQVAQFDPTFDATNFNARAKGRASAISGKLAQSNNALNTAIGHLDTLSGQASGTASHGGFPFATTVNAVQNWFSKGEGDKGVTNFEDTAAKLADELESAYRNGGGAEAGVIRQLRSLDPNMSGDQKQGIIHNAMDLLASKMSANLAQYNFGTGGKPTWDMLDPHVKQVLDSNPDIRDKYFAAPAGGSATPPANPNAPPPVGPQGGPPPVSPQGGVPHADYSGMVGGPQSTLATMDQNSKLGAFQQTYRNEYDPVGAATLSTFIKHGAPYETAAAYAQSHGFSPPDPKAYAEGVAFAQQHNGATNVEANRSVPTTLGERLVSSPAAAAFAGGVTGATAGLSDVVGRTVVGRGWDANRQALAQTNPGSDFAGNVIGGAAGMFGGSAAAKALGLTAKLGKLAPTLGDLAYGGVYGGSENPDHPLTGATLGALLAGGGGWAGRGIARGTGNSIAPTGGDLAPIFKANPDFRPTIGQRLSASPSRFLQALGKGEQAAESIPFAGGIQTSARSAGTDQMQRGAFNHALGDLTPFNSVLGRDVSQLPKGVVKGPEAHTFMQGAFDDAYKQARSRMQFVADPQYGQDLGAWQHGGMALTDSQSQHINSVIAKTLKGRVNGNVMDGTNYQAAASDLSRVARQWASRPETSAQAAHLRDFISIMDDAAKRSSSPEAGALLEAANKGYGKSVIIENAARAAGGEPAEFTGKQLLKAVQSGDSSVRDRSFLRGQALMQDYATAASKLSPSLADSGTPQRTAWMKLAGTGEAGVLAAATAPTHGLALAPWVIDTIANAPGVRNVVGAAMAPREAVLPQSLANLANIAGKGIKNRANNLGMLAAPGATGYYLGQ